MTRPRNPVRLALAFAPLHKVAFGAATGLAAALVTFLVTGVYLVRGPTPGFDLGLLAEFFYGYTVSWPGAFVGAIWAGFVGFVFGWFLALVRNVVLAVMVLEIRSRAELDETRDFLDHI